MEQDYLYCEICSYLQIYGFFFSSLSDVNRIFLSLLGILKTLGVGG